MMKMGWVLLGIFFFSSCQKKGRITVDHKLSPLQSSGAKEPQFEVEELQEVGEEEKKCVATKDVICGPFSEELRKMCEIKGGGHACGSDEWNQKFYHYIKISLEEKKNPSSISSSSSASQIKTSPLDTASKDLEGLKVALDVGHGAFAEEGGGWETGAVNPWNKEITEHRENWRQAKKCAEVLESRGAKVSIFAYEYGTTGLTLNEKGKKASGYHIFISMHKNATETHDTQGTETLYDTSATTEDKKLADRVQKEMMKYLWNNNENYDRGARPQGLGILKGVPLTVKAAILTEAYFLDVKFTEDKFADMSEASGVAVAEGIAGYWLQSK